ncbi:MULTISPECIES: GNAT family N-acetyltransferase [unclassified Curtobacterium]|uniref:GNAT family N-acetyltransferase n=1 Tax=unclassified Curtobacterium TaxID=257496 RepID=UPI001611E102|nr:MULTISPECIES: GNAT family N-acetyltransferase [unclassified Curtobacterium]
MTAYTVHELVVPATMDDDPGVVQAFREWVDVQNRAEVSITGLPELLWTPEEQLPYLIDPDAPSRLFLARDDVGTAVGAGSYDSKAVADSPNCWMAVSVAPEHRRRGIGTLLAEHVEAVARQQGRTQWKTYAVSRQVGSAAGTSVHRPGSASCPRTTPESGS